jgi:elongation factor P
MMKMNAIDLRPGHIIEYNDKLWTVLDTESVHPGKGQSVTQVVMRDIDSGTKKDVRFRTQETVDRVRLYEDDFQYLYAEGPHHIFMNTDSYEQLRVPAEIIGEDRLPFLSESMMVRIETHEGRPMRIHLPDTVEAQITDTEPVIKGQTATSSYKPATLDNGLRTSVPPHVDRGDTIVVKTDDGSYVEKVS